MYKRRARVLFVEAPPRGLAQAAVAWARELAWEWVEARAAAPGDSGAAPEVLEGLGLAPQPLFQLTPEQLAWADLVVALTPEALADCAPPPGTQLKPWLLGGASAAGADTLHAHSLQLRERVAGLAGGMRMLARGRPPTSDAECARPPPAAGSRD